MEKRFEQIELFLKQVAEELANKPENNEYGQYEIYDKLARFGLSEDDIEFRDEDEAYLEDTYNYDIRRIKRTAETLKDRWIELVQWRSIKRCPYILKKVEENFIYIGRKDVQENLEEFDDKSSIKIYVPLGKKGVTKIIQLLLPMMEKSNLDVKHNSKISADIRTDDFVIRVNSIEEAEKIVNYLSSDNEYKDIDVPKYSDLLIEPNPFVMRINNIGFASDRDLSYNDNVANYINQYMQELKVKGQLAEASREGFATFLKSKYDSMFKEGNFQEEYQSDKYFVERCGSLEKWLMNRMEVADLILIALDPQTTMQTFYEHWNDINDKEYNKKLEQYFTNLAQGIKTEIPLKPSQLKREEESYRESEEANEILKLAREKVELSEKVGEAQKLLKDCEEQLPAEEISQDGN